MLVSDISRPRWIDLRWYYSFVQEAGKHTKGSRCWEESLPHTEPKFRLDELICCGLRLGTIGGCSEVDNDWLCSSDP